MDFTFNDDHLDLQEAVRAFAEAEIRPLAEEMDRTDQFPMQLWPRMGEMGLLGMGVSEAYGGSEGDIWGVVIAGEEIAAASSSVALSMGAHGNLCVYNLFRNGNEAQKQKYLPELCAGTKIGSLCITEPDTGSDAVGMKTLARRDGDHYVLNGSKTWITNAPIADVFIVYAKTRPEAGARGISAFIVERGMPGLSTSQTFHKMGNRGSPTGQVFFENCRVPAENLVGVENMGIAIVMGGLDIERTVFSALSIGLARRAMELSIRYAQERQQFGKPIARFQLIQAKIADMYTQLEAARLMVYRATDELSRMTRGGKGTEIHKRSAAALLFAAETSEKIAYDAVQIHGGNGYSDEYEVSRIYRDVRLGTIGAGTSEIRRLIIAREILGLG
jgi:isovaleryl-CoA dehydrogenase